MPGRVFLVGSLPSLPISVGNAIRSLIFHLDLFTDAVSSRTTQDARHTLVLSLS